MSRVIFLTLIRPSLDRPVVPRIHLPFLVRHVQRPRGEVQTLVLVLDGHRQRDWPVRAETGGAHAQGGVDLRRGGHGAAAVGEGDDA